jgi:hypothetical protein
LRKNKTELEQAINKSPLFTVSAENWSARDKAKAALMNDLWEYCKDRPVHSGNTESKTYRDYGLEVWQAMTSSISHFDPNKGKSFLHFFNAYCKRFLEKELYRSEFKTSRDGCFISPEMIDQIEDSDNEYHRAMPGPEGTLEKKKTPRLVTEYLEIIEKAFLEKQKRIQSRLRTLWTFRCFNALLSIDLSGKKYAWIDYDFLDKYQNVEELPTQKEVAALYGKSEQAASRDLASLYGIVLPRFQEAEKIIPENC